MKNGLPSYPGELLMKAQKKAAKTIPTIYLVRHGETNLNTGVEKIRGWDNVPLNAKGRQQAKHVASKLADKGIEKIYSSDLSRAHDTAKAIAKKSGAPVKVTRKLRPWHLGKFTAQPVKEILPQVKSYIESPGKTVPQGESLKTFTNRFNGELKSVMKEAERNGRPIALVAHYRNLRQAEALLGHRDEKFLMKKGKEKTSSVLKISKVNGKWKARLI